MERARLSMRWTQKFGQVRIGNVGAISHVTERPEVSIDLRYLPNIRDVWNAKPFRHFRSNLPRVPVNRLLAAHDDVIVPELLHSTRQSV